MLSQKMYLWIPIVNVSKDFEILRKKTYGFGIKDFEILKKFGYGFEIKDFEILKKNAYGFGIKGFEIWDFEKICLRIWD